MKTYTGDNRVYCNDCDDQTDATSVSFDLKMKTQTEGRSVFLLEYNENVLLVYNTEIKDTTHMSVFVSF